MIRRFFARRSVQMSTSVVMSAIFLYFALRSLSWTEFFSAISQFDRRWFVPSMALAIILYGVRALRWQAILRPICPMPVHFLFQAIVLGFFVNILLPINIGEVLRAYLVKREYDVSMFTVFGSAAVERVVGLIAFWIVGVIAVLTIALPPEVALLRQRVLLGMGAGLILLAMLVLFVFWLRQGDVNLGGVGQWLARRMSTRWQVWLSSGWRHFRTGLRFGGTRRAAVVILLYSILLRLLAAMVMWCMARGFGISLPLLAYIFADVLVSVAHVVGSHLLGIVGSFEVGLVYMLGLFGAAKEVGLGVALLMRVAYATPLLVLGVTFFFTQRLSWSDIRWLQQQAAKPPSEGPDPIAQQSLPRVES